MAFDVEQFVQEVSWEAFDDLKKPDSMALAAYFGIQVKHAMRKQAIKNMLFDRLVADNFLDEESSENKIEILDSSDSAVKLQQLGIQKEIELAKLQMQEQESQEKLHLEKEKCKLRNNKEKKSLKWKKSIKAP